MAYDKHTWTCDEPITVERLNHIEDGIANAGGGECGFECEDEMVTLTEESVTTSAQGDFNYGELSYSQFINADSITVTFDGVEYECPRIAAEYGNWYGGVDQSDPDFSEYPFVVLSLSGLGNNLYTETAGTHTIKIEDVETIATTTPCFDLARGYSCDAKQMVIEESVTTQGDDAIGVFSNASLIDAETIKVTFNGTEYECEQSKHSGGYIYGGFSTTPTPHPDFSQYPFVILSRLGNGNMLITETAGTYAVKIEWTKETVTTTPCFEKAVKLVSGEVVYAKMESEVDEDGCTIYTLDITDDDLAQIIRNGQQLVILEPTGKTGGNYAMHYPMLVWVNGVSPALPIFQASPGGVGDPVAMVTITMVDQFTLNERLLTLFAYSGTASPRYLEGKMCVSEDPLVVPLNRDISAATTSSLVKSLAPGVYNSIMNALNNGVSVYLREQSSKEMLLVTACNAGSGMTNATITVNIEKTDGTLGITYSKPIKFHFDANGRCYYPMSAQ